MCAEKKIFTYKLILIISGTVRIQPMDDKPPIIIIYTVMSINIISGKFAHVNDTPMSNLAGPTGKTMKECVYNGARILLMLYTS